MITYRHSAAYRLPNGEIEGFRGFSKGYGSPSKQKEQAREDVYDQIKRKLRLINNIKRGSVEFDLRNFIDFEADMTPEELEKVRKDWESGFRY